MIEIKKSPRHSKIAGDFGETMVMYWLSKYGYDVANVDFTGIDLIAYNNKTKRRLGISVKARTRKRRQGYSSVTLPSKQELGVCKSFHCKPYLALVIDSIDDGGASGAIRLYLLPWREVEQQLRRSGQKSFKMEKDYLNIYESSPQIKKITFNYKIKDWK